MEMAQAIRPNHLDPSVLGGCPPANEESGLPIDDDTDLEVYVSQELLTSFLSSAEAAYRANTVDRPVPCFAVLLGSEQDNAISLESLEFGRNVRASDTNVLEEFSTEIVPRFGEAYRNPCRGWWIAPNDVLRIAKLADSRNLDIVGSIHFHPDRHRLQGLAERRMVLSAKPTSMDEYVFVNCGWPVNIICYLETVNEVLYHTVQAWGLPGRRDPQHLRQLPLHIADTGQGGLLRSERAA
jgi:hypothetical protein